MLVGSVRLPRFPVGQETFRNRPVNAVPRLRGHDALVQPVLADLAAGEGDVLLDAAQHCLETIHRLGYPTRAHRNAAGGDGLWQWQVNGDGNGNISLLRGTQRQELNDFLAPERRRTEFSVTCAQAATTKHMIEALGVPHTEVELILVNGESADFDRLLRDGDRVAAYAGASAVGWP